MRVCILAADTWPVVRAAGDPLSHAAVGHGTRWVDLSGVKLQGGTTAPGFDPAPCGCVLK